MNNMYTTDLIDESKIYDWTFDNMIHLTPDNIEYYYEEYEKWYDKKLAGAEVKKHSKTSKMGFALLTLFANSRFQAINEIPLHGDHITSSYKKFYNDDKVKEIQIRHLCSQHGYQITSPIKGYRILDSLEPKEGYFVVRREPLNTDNWEELKKSFDYRCATCSSKEGEQMLKRKANGITVLEQGHCDPRKPLTMDNCIPQCRYCNGIAMNKFIFDNEGNVKEQINKR